MYRRFGLQIVALAAAFAMSCANDSPPDSTAGAPAPAAAAGAPDAGVPMVTGQAPVSSGGATVVVLEPREPREFDPPATPPVMDQVQREFVPSMLVAPAGHPILFLNNDPELHNLNVKESITRAQAFNVAIPQHGKYTHTLAKPGVYDVSCDIHPTMAAVILAAASPYLAYADETGGFSISGVPPGAYIARAYGTFTPVEREVHVTAGRTEINFR
jgi:plastocyanin